MPWHAFVRSPMQTIATGNDVKQLLDDYGVTGYDIEDNKSSPKIWVTVRPDIPQHIVDKILYEMQERKAVFMEFIFMKKLN